MINTTAIIQFLRNHINGIKIIYLYGSYAQGRATPDSDVDLAVLAEQKLEPKKKSGKIFHG